MIRPTTAPESMRVINGVPFDLDLRVISVFGLVLGEVNHK